MAPSVYVFYRDPKKFQGQSHIGLGNNALLLAKSLVEVGIPCRIFAIDKYEDIVKAMQDSSCNVPTHCIVEAGWVSVDNAANLSKQFHTQRWCYRNHSQWGFLQVEPSAIKLFRNYSRFQEQTLNVDFSANSQRFAEHWRSTYNQRCVYLPNLYPTIDRTRSKRRRPNEQDRLRIGSFGALRLLKNHTTAAAAALLLARNQGKQLDFYINSGRNENNGGQGIRASIENMFEGLRWATLHLVNWEEWADFRHTVAFMDVCIHTSFTETFSIVTADASAEYVPTVVGPATEWMPKRWQVDPDDALDIAQTAAGLLANPQAGDEAFEQLVQYQQQAIQHWQRYLKA